MRVLARLIIRLLRRRRSVRRPRPPIDPEWLHDVYRDTHRQVEDLRRAA